MKKIFNLIGMGIFNKNVCLNCYLDFSESWLGIFNYCILWDIVSILIVLGYI